MIGSKSVLCGVTALALAHALPARAQQAAEAAVEGSMGLEEVIVTAEKRSGTAQTTPIALSVIDAGDLQRSGVASLRDLSSFTPGVGLTQGSGGGTTLKMGGRS